MAENIFGYIRVSTKEQNEDRQLIAMQGLNIPEKTSVRSTRGWSAG